MRDFGLYIIITKPVLCHETVAEICVANKIKMLQLREKDLADKELLRIAKNIRAITKGTETKFIINDRPDIAKLCNADMLHLGQEDLALNSAQEIFGVDKLYGLSTHSLAQAQEALPKQPAYIGFGPIFPTNAKKNPDPVVGIQKLAEVMKFAAVPVVAIGGIFPENIEQVLQAGAKNIAMVRYFMQARDLDRRIKEVNNLLRINK